MATDAVTEFINSGSTGFPSFKFKAKGDKLVGTIVSRSIVETRALGSTTGEKVKNLVIGLKTDEVHTQTQTDGSEVSGDEWSLWIKPSQLLSELGRSLREAGAAPGSPLVGDRLGVVFTDTEAPKQAGHSPKKIYTVSFKQGDLPAPSVSSVDDLL